jgi:cytidine deaminase
MAAPHKDSLAEDRELLQYARKAYENAHAPYTKRAFGAAVRAADGSVHIGCSIETVAFTGSYCAEQVAIGHAIASGVRDLTTLALYPADYPCGMCRQVMLEFNDEFELVIEQDQKIRRISLKELLPSSFAPQRQAEFGQGE